MAALLCTLPCQIVGNCCSGLMKFLNESCKCLADALKPIADLLCDCTRPFTFIATIAAFVLGTPIVFIGNALRGQRPTQQTIRRKLAITEMPRSLPLARSHPPLGPSACAAVPARRRSQQPSRSALTGRGRRAQRQGYGST
jgi:hypothetical protein